MTIERFAKECQRHLDAGHEFIAYWHAHGFMLLVTNQPYTSFKVVPTTRGINQKETKRTRVQDSTIKRARKIIDQLKKQRGIGPVCTVEYMDGQLIIGGEADEVHTLRIPGGGH